MKTFKELKTFCDKEIEKYPDLEKPYRKEIFAARRFYDNGRNLYEELLEKKDNINDGFIIPALLGLKEIPSIDKVKRDYIQVKSGASGGIDIDSDLSGIAKEKVFDYLKEKYGEERVVSVGTFGRLGVASAAKDLLRVAGVDFKESVILTKELDSNISWEDNLSALKVEKPAIYAIYLKHKELLDNVPKFVNKVRQIGKHAGGVVITDEPVYNLVPVERVSNTIVTAFPESSSAQVLDEIGVVKFDILAISVLDVIANTLNSIDEKMYLIEDDDGIEKIVPESYLEEINVNE